MPDTRAPTVPSFTRRLAIETPEHLVLELELAGIGSRMAATVCDAGVLTLAYLLLGLAIQLLPTPASGDANGPWSTLGAIVLILTAFLLFWGYFLLFEALNNGRTPGKRLMGIRVVMDTGHPLTFTAAAVRNLVRIVDMQPLFTYQVGLGFVLFHRQNKRLGDDVAEPLVLPMEQHEAESDLVGKQGLHVHDPHEIADGGGGERERMSGVHHDADAHQALTRGPAVVERLEQQEVAPEEQERREDQDDRAERAPRAVRITARRGREQLDCQAQKQVREGEDTRVAHRRGHAGADAGQLELEHEVLRRLDRKTPRERRYGRGSRVRHLGGILTAEEDQWLPSNCGRWRWGRS